VLGDVDVGTIGGIVVLIVEGEVVTIGYQGHKKHYFNK